MYFLCGISIVCVYSSLFSFDIFFFKQKTAYEMRISDWSSDVCSSDLLLSKEFGGKRWPLWSEELPPFQRTFAAVLMSLHPGDRHSETVAIAEQACMPKSGP